MFFSKYRKKIYELGKKLDEANEVLSNLSKENATIVYTNEVDAGAVLFNIVYNNKDKFFYFTDDTGDNKKLYSVFLAPDNKAKVIITHYNQLTTMIRSDNDEITLELAKDERIPIPMNFARINNIFKPRFISTEECDIKNDYISINNGTYESADKYEGNVVRNVYKTYKGYYLGYVQKRHDSEMLSIEFVNNISPFRFDDIHNLLMLIESALCAK